MPNRNEGEKSALKSNKPGLNRLLALLDNTSISITDLERISHSLDWLERAAVARHCSATESLLQKLSDDSNSVVGALASERISKLNKL